ncbi:unnamed protein product [Bursaphelenchus okinawaensis]|uniref:Acyltransferase C-terminal domain-containing protein n=1 Tax=Bursaphelenchus okinawaensis TaxID=465554 RepID=A0A811LST3_9BILA|nr:unnamed protein product [Bursaphelenchus okinawaensis]CAG9127908.1 unnamed protein product [Bursaphelenchus okinawaensis]
MYPEGSRLYLIREAEKNFAKKAGIQPFKHCSHPRTGAAHTTLAVCGPSLKDSSKSNAGNQPPMEYVVDCTLGYPRGEVVDLGKAMLNEWPNNDTHVAVHYSIHKVKPEWNDEEKLKEWLYQRYEEKDRLLEQFYKTGSFGGRPRPVRFPISRSLQTQAFWMCTFYVHWHVWISPLIVFGWTSITAILF